ncbi:hypothetical protein BJ508DRAFT_358378 [Ascobolus immersus RN42]|uniref:Uncharacterized protein n=1 Tax=Ascobolus immersus RN42 TaxID=1160509 RepID=A0A3N4IXA3_ASCIM|nr:hypothetical protein BJ508DRAFT_358378 [Ascobolus immersus RN42]
MRRTTRVSKWTAQRCVGPRVDVTKYFNEHKVNYGLWGSLGLLLGMLCSPRETPNEVDFVIADRDLLSACSIVEKLGYVRQAEGKTGIFGFPPKVGKLEEIQRFCPRKQGTNAPTNPLPINLIPASLVDFRDTEPAYIMESEVVGRNGDVWKVCHPSLPGLMDAALSMTDKHARDEDQHDFPHYTMFDIRRDAYTNMPINELRSQMLFFHGKSMWLQMVDITFKWEDQGGRDSYEEIPERLLNLAYLLKPSNGEYFLDLILTFPVYDEDFWELEEKQFAEESWEEVFGVDAVEDELPVQEPVTAFHATQG